MFCTIIHPARLPHARVLAQGLAEHHPEIGLTALLLSATPKASRTEPFELLTPSDMNAPGWEALLDEGRWADLTEYFKPRLLHRLMAERSLPAIYLDAAVDVQAPLVPAFAALERHGVVIAPRLLGELPIDRKRPDGEDLRRAGRYGASLIGLGARQAGMALANWWVERTSNALSLIPSHSADAGPAYRCEELGRWIDVAPSVIGDTEIIRDRGSAVSCWNLHDRQLERADGSHRVDGRTLRFLHFDGFDPARPFLLDSRIGASRVLTSHDPVLSELCESYARRLVAAGWHDRRQRADVGRELPNGITFDDRFSRLLASATDAGAEIGDIFTGQGCDSLMRWLEQPAPYGGSHGINRFLYAIYREREDLQIAYPDLDGDGSGFAGWAHVFGAREMGVPERFLPPPPPGIETSSHSSTSDRDLAVRRPLPRGKPPTLSMRVTGMLTGTLGLGEAARGYVSALRAAGIPVSTHTVDAHDFIEVERNPDPDYATVDFADIAADAPDGFNLVCVNADELPVLARSMPDGSFDAPSIGVWAWETDRVPERWAKSFELLDEIWVYSDYVANNIGRVSPIPVRRVPPPVPLPDAGAAELDLALPEGFQFLFMFDFFSTIQRKNPLGLIEAFRRAFEPGDGPQLVLKTINGVHRPSELEQLMWAARGRDDVHVVDRSLSARERDALVAGCDCYVSLHRSEGFGLTLAECMALAKPVIATAFSGTTDFMTADNSYLVPYEMVRVGADCEIYPADGTWADPDIDAAAGLMREVVDRPDQARAKGELARRDIERAYSPEAIGELIRSRLTEIGSLWTNGAGPVAQPSVAPGVRSDRSA